MSAEMTSAECTTYLARGAVTVRLKAPQEVTAVALRTLDPYIVRAGSAAGDTASWTIVVGAVNDEDISTVVVPSPPEPEMRFAFSVERRLIAIEPRGSTEWQAQTVTRLVRGVHRLELVVRGAVALHAAMVMVDGVGVALVGPKRSGKTTMMIALLATAGGAYVSNDDLLVVGTDTPRALGWPRTVAIREDSLAAVRTLGPSLLDVSTIHPAAPAFAEAAARGAQRTHYLYPTELVARLGTSLLTSSPLDLLVFPRFGETTSLERLSATATYAELFQNVEPVVGRGFEPIVKAIGLPRPGAGAVLQRLSRLPAFQLSHSFDELGESTARIREAAHAVA